MDGNEEEGGRRAEEGGPSNMGVCVIGKRKGWGEGGTKESDAARESDQSACIIIYNSVGAYECVRRVG